MSSPTAKAASAPTLVKGNRIIMGFWELKTADTGRHVGYMWHSGEYVRSRGYGELENLRSNTKVGNKYATAIEAEKPTMIGLAKQLAGKV
jgi:hypothetical protein